MHLTHLLTEEQIMLRDTLRKFVDKEIMPIRDKLEEDRSLVEGIHQKLVDLGIQKGGYPEEYGGTGPYDTMTLGIISEELARGDAGISITAGINAGMLFGPAVMADNKTVLEKFVPDFCGDKVNYACLAMTDSTGGADTENPLLKGRGIMTRAKMEGKEWVINGNKSWPTNAGIADAYLVVCTTDPEAGENGICLIYVPKDAPGLSFGKPETKMGYRTSVNASIFFDNVRVPREYRLSGPGLDAKFYYAGVMAGAQWHVATMCLGMAQAGFDIALDYTKERKSGGKPVREWSMAAGVIAEMALDLEMMRGAVYNLSTMLDKSDHYGIPFTDQMISKASITRLYCCQGCLSILGKAIELLGSNGISAEYHLEKYYRDAKVISVVLGGPQIAKYRIARGYYDYALY